MLSSKLKFVKKNKFSKKAFYASTPMHTIFPGVSQTSEQVSHQWKAPKLDTIEGIKVVTIDTNVPFTSVSLSFASGSRVESSKNAGAAAFVKHLAYKATANHTQVGITREIELKSVSFNSAASREDISYNAKLARYQLADFFPILGEVSRPKIREFEIRLQGPNVVAEATALSKDTQHLLVERLHRVAFRGTGLGRPISPLSSRASLSAASWTSALREYVDTYFVKERALVVVTGINASEVTPLVTSSLSSLPSNKAGNEAPKASKYYGGEHFGDKGGKSHILLGFQGVPLTSPHLHALNIIYTILGGGLKYTKEGPGNGKTSLLNRNVVEKVESVQAASTYNASYRDNGLFAVYVQTNGDVNNAVDSVVDQINSLSKISASQLEAAKKQLKIQLSTYYDTTDKRVELSKRFVLAGADPVCYHNFIQAVDKVTLEDVKNVAKNVFSSKPTLVTEGDIDGLYGADQIASKLR